MEVSMYGIDIAKNVFQVHGADALGRMVVQKRLRRGQVLDFFRVAPKGVAAMEACGSAHHWGRELMKLGHEVRLIPPAYVKPYVMRNKTDARDAAAICEAGSRPHMRRVPVKTIEAQADRALQRTHDLLVRQRTAAANAIRGHLGEMGIAAPSGRAGLARLMEMVAAQDAAIPQGLIAPLEALARQHRALNEEIDALKAAIASRVRQDAAMKRLTRIPMVGPMTAHAMVAAIGDGKQFNSARDFAAWLGLTPKQASSGEKTLSGKISKQGDEPLRRLFVLGAATALRRPEKASPWLKGLIARRPAKVAMIAQAAKTARIAWAVHVSHEGYRSVPKDRADRVAAA
jgi:transposase